jgi:hypothetical protein
MTSTLRGRARVVAAWTGALILLSTGCTATDPSPPEPLPSTGGDQISIAVPAYVDPKNSDYWQSIVDAAPQLQDVIVNPLNGPGTTRSERHVQLIGTLQAAGIRVLGYVMTGWGERDIAEVNRDVDRWREWYGVTNIFLDEAASVPEEVETYAGYVGIVHGNGGVAVLNPGIIPDRGYFDYADAIVTFEDPFDAYFEAKDPPAWLQADTGTELWHIVSGAPQEQLGDVVDRAREQGVRKVYVTDDQEPNPYDSLPSYWSAKREAVEE